MAANTAEAGCVLLTATSATASALRPAATEATAIRLRTSCKLIAMVFAVMLSAMDANLLAWARAVKSRQRANACGTSSRIPPLWFFTDSLRTPDPLPAIAALPRGLAGIVLRHDGVAGRATLARQAARLAHARRLVLVIAGDARLAAAVGAGVHLREGRWPGVTRPRLRRGTLVTSSAHGRPALVRARRTGATLAFLSPTFATASHTDSRPLGPVRWAGLAQPAPLSVAALGGISGASVARLGRTCAAAAAITAMLP